MNISAVFYFLMTLFAMISVSAAERFEAKSYNCDWNGPPYNSQALKAYFESVKPVILAAPAIESKRMDPDTLEAIFNDLNSEGRIRVLNCDKKARIDGAYLPDLNLLYIKKDQNPQDFAFSLFHELTHGYQYFTRYGFDAHAIESVKRKHKAENLEGQDLLNYFYESQATWYGISAKMLPDWTNFEKQVQNDNSLLAFAKTTVALPKVFARTFLEAGLRPFGIKEDFADLERFYTKSWMLGDPKSPLEAVELITLENYPWELIHSRTPSEKWVRKFHSRVAKKLAISYFGNTDLIFRPKGSDEEIFVALQEQAYKEYFKQTSLAEKTPFEIYQAVKQAHESPVQAWQVLMKNVGSNEVMSTVGTSPAIRIQPLKRIRP